MVKADKDKVGLHLVIWLRNLRKLVWLVEPAFLSYVGLLMGCWVQKLNAFMLHRCCFASEVGKIL